MSTSARIGYGMQFKIGNGASPEVFTEVAECTNITPPGFARDAIDASHHQSPEAYREFIAGLKDGASKTATVTATKADGSKKTFEAKVLLLTPKEVEYFRNGGILQYVLRQLAAKKAA